jgi:hypothetical protein
MSIQSDPLSDVARLQGRPDTAVLQNSHLNLNRNLNLNPNCHPNVKINSNVKQHVVRRQLHRRPGAYGRKTHMAARGTLDGGGANFAHSVPNHKGNRRRVRMRVATEA